MSEPTWFRDLLPAKFGGAAFRVSAHQREGGRRGPDHEFPEQSTGATEDLGEKIARWTFDAFVLGDEHHQAAQELIDALQRGRGELVHPRWGHQIAICRTWTHGESVDDAGISRFTLNFTDASNELGVAIIVSGDAIVDEVAKKVKTAAAAAFVETFTVSGLSGSVANLAIADLAGRVATVVTQVEGPLSGALADAAAFVTLSASVVDNAAALVATPAELAADLVALLEAIGDRLALRTVTASRPTSLTQGVTLPVDPGEAQVLHNGDAFTRLIQRVALAEYAGAVVAADFGTYDDAVAELDAVSALLEVEESAPNTKDEYEQIVDLRVEFVATVGELATDLVRLRDFVVRGMTSTLEMAWELYRDANRAEEIADRNAESIAHPGFVRPGTYRVLAE